MHGQDRLKFWTLKGAKSHSKCISTTFFLLLERNRNPEIWLLPEKPHTCWRGQKVQYALWVPRQVKHTESQSKCAVCCLVPKTSETVIRSKCLVCITVPKTSKTHTDLVKMCRKCAVQVKKTTSKTHWSVQLWPGGKAPDSLGRDHADRTKLTSTAKNLSALSYLSSCSSFYQSTPESQTGDNPLFF